MVDSIIWYGQILLDHPVDIVCTDKGAVGADFDHIDGVLGAGGSQLRWDSALGRVDGWLPDGGAPKEALGAKPVALLVLVVPEIDQDVLARLDNS